MIATNNEVLIHSTTNSSLIKCNNTESGFWRFAQVLLSALVFGGASENFRRILKALQGDSPLVPL